MQRWVVLLLCIACTTGLTAAGWPLPPRLAVRMSGRSTAGLMPPMTRPAIPALAGRGEAGLPLGRRADAAPRLAPTTLPPAPPATPLFLSASALQAGAGLGGAAAALFLLWVAWGLSWREKAVHPWRGGWAMAAAADASDYTGVAVDPQVRRVLADCGVAVDRLAARFPLERCPAAAVEAAVRCLRDAGVDVRRAVVRHPALLVYPEEHLRAVMRELAGHQLKVARVLSEAPQVADLPHADLRATIAFLQALGVDVRRATKRHPPLLCAPPAALQPAVDWLQGLGLAPGPVATEHPQVLQYPIAHLDARVQCLRDLGLDPAAMLGKFPHLFGGSEEALQRTAGFLRTMEVDPDPDADVDADPDAATEPAAKPQTLASGEDGRLP